MIKWKMFKPHQSFRKQKGNLIVSDKWMTFGSSAQRWSRSQSNSRGIKGSSGGSDLIVDSLYDEVHPVKNLPTLMAPCVANLGAAARRHHSFPCRNPKAGTSAPKYFTWAVREVKQRASRSLYPYWEPLSFTASPGSTVLWTAEQVLLSQVGHG